MGGGETRKTKGRDFSRPLAARIRHMVSNTCIIFIIFLSLETKQPSLFFSRPFVFILNKTPFALGRRHFLLLRRWQPLKIRREGVGGVMCHLAIFGPPLPARFPSVPSYCFSFGFFSPLSF